VAAKVNPKLGDFRVKGTGWVEDITEGKRGPTHGAFNLGMVVLTSIGSANMRTQRQLPWHNWGSSAHPNQRAIGVRRTGWGGVGEKFSEGRAEKKMARKLAQLVVKSGGERGESIRERPRRSVGRRRTKRKKEA